MKTYKYRRTHTYDYEVHAKSEKEALIAVKKVWAADYKNMTLSDYKLISTTDYRPVKPEATPAVIHEPEATQAVAKKTAKKAVKKTVKKAAKKKARVV